MHTATTNTGGRDLIKGILILLVIADHNDFIRTLFKSEFKPLTLHVLGFFFLAAHYTMQGGMQRASLADKAVRYGVPFLLFYAAYSLMYHVLGMAAGGAALTDLAVDVVAGAAIGSFVLVKQGAGTAFLWFLPAFFGFVLLAGQFSKTVGNARVAMLVALWIVHVTIGMLPAAMTTAMPFGLTTALYILPLAILCGRLEKLLVHVSNAAFAVVVTGCLSVLSYAYLVRSGTNIEIGALEVPAFPRHWDILLAHDVSVVSGFLFLCLLASRDRLAPQFMYDLGKHSLLVYLIHPAIFFIVRTLITRVLPDFPSMGGSWVTNAGLSLASIFLTACVSLGIARVILHFPALTRCMTPRGVDDWLQGAAGLFRRLKVS